MNEHPDFVEFLRELARNRVEFVVVGAHALGFHGHPRATGDIDIWIRPTLDNARAVLKVIDAFGFGSLGLRLDDFAPDKVVQMGVAPVRIDLLTGVEGVTPDELWASKVPGKFADMDVFFISKEHFIRNKFAAGRLKDLADLEALGVPVPKPPQKDP